MTTLTVRDLDDETVTGLKELSAEHGRSMGAEARAILAEAVRRRQKPSAETGLGSRIQELFADLARSGVEPPSRDQAAVASEEPTARHR